MNPYDLKNRFGNEYPAAVVINGVRMSLTRERRFSRTYRSVAPRMGADISRFMDGSAAITAPELQREWPGWTEEQRMDFCGACSWLQEQADFPEMLRFMMQHAGPREWSQIASSVA